MTRAIVLALIASASLASARTDTPPTSRPTPRNERATMIDLAGKWNFYVGDDLPGRRVPAKQAMPVPSNWYRHGLEHDGVVWFGRRVELPAGRWWIELDGVDYRCAVYWNGVKLGEHTGYFDRFAFAVPEGAGSHDLAIRVDSPNETVTAWSLHKTLIKGVLSHHDTRPGGAWTPEGQKANTGGIWGGVRLVPANTARIDEVHATTASLTRTSATLDLAATITPAQGADVDVRWRITDPKGNAVKEGTWRGRGVMRVRADVSNPQAWFPRELGTPALYRLEISAGADREERRFGIRTVVRDPGGRYLFNGVPMFLRGTNYIGSLYLTDLNRKVVRKDLDLMIGANINAIRVHAHVTAPAFYDLADELGLVVWQDFPLQWGYDDSEAFADEAARQLRAMISTLGDHPSVVHWTAQNEAPYSSDWMVWKYPDYDRDQNRVLSAKLSAALATDPTRPWQANSASAEHAWFGWYSGTYKDFDKAQTQPILTEFGAQALPSLATLRTILREDQLWPLDANLSAWEYHNFQKHELVTIAKVAIPPTLNELITVTQQYQARLFQYAAEGLRRQAWLPVTGIFQFMFVEHWPSMNWGTVDYLRRPKPGYATLRRAYQPVLAMLGPRGKKTLRLYVANDRPSQLVGAVIVKRTTSRGPVMSRKIMITVAPTAVAVGEEVSIPAKDESVTLTVVDQTGKVISENSYGSGYFNE